MKGGNKIQRKKIGFMWSGLYEWNMMIMLVRYTPKYKMMCNIDHFKKGVSVTMTIKPSTQTVNVNHSSIHSVKLWFPSFSNPTYTCKTCKTYYTRQTKRRYYRSVYLDIVIILPRVDKPQGTQEGESESILISSCRIVFNSNFESFECDTQIKHSSHAVSTYLSYLPCDYSLIL